MQLPAVRKLLTYSHEELKAAETALMDGKPLPMEVEGHDEGEQLTHLLGAIWIKEQVAGGMDEKEALRAFASRVRDSIG